LPSISTLPNGNSPLNVLRQTSPIISNGISSTFSNNNKRLQLYRFGFNAPYVDKNLEDALKRH